MLTATDRNTLDFPGSAVIVAHDRTRGTSLLREKIELISPQLRDIPDLGRICFAAFRSIHDRHAFPRDFPDVHAAIKVLWLIANVRGAFAVAARTGGRLIGSNFALLTDEVAGVGPLSIDPAWQGRGLGRRLMQAVIDHATERGVERVRLMQDSFNTASLSLYASLGFDVREAVGMLRLPHMAAPDPTVRLASRADFPDLRALSEQLYGVDRSREMTEWSWHGIPIFVRESRGVLKGYAMPGMLGHGVAETEADAVALISQLSRHASPGMDVVFVPLRQTSLYRAAMRAGARLIKVMTLMTRGEYEEPRASWMPSIFY